MDGGESYNASFFDTQKEGALKSAEIVVPLVAELVRPCAVVDVGCGLGAWLAPFKDYGVTRILGIDGDYVDTSSLLIPRDCFRPLDLNRPVAVGEKFDLAVCLEVAEHLPETSAQPLIRFLCDLAPVILFSAAVPGQTGTNHINEQWPEYWKTLFARHGYVRIDAIRKLIWKNREVDWWYRQNTFFYVHQDAVAFYPDLARTFEEADDLVLIHRGIIEKYVWLPEVIKRLPSRVLEAATGRFPGTSRDPK